jgi:glycosyltransferase 2 family protein
VKKYLAGFLKLAVSLGVGIGVVYVFVSKMSDTEKQQVITDIGRANYIWVIAPVILGFISNYFRSQRWRLLLRPLGYKPGLFNTFFSVMIMYFLNLFFPRLGEVSRCGVLSRYEGVPLDKAIGTMVLERLVDVLCLGIILLVLVTTQAQKFWALKEEIGIKSAQIAGKYQINDTLKYGVLLGVALLIIAFLAYRINKQGLDVFIAEVKERVMGLVKGIISIKDIGNPWEFVFHTVMIWVCYFSMGYVGFFMFPETSQLPMVTALMCLAFSAVAFSLTPGGLGLFPIFMQLVVNVYGVAGSAALSYGLVSWSAQTASVLIGGVISLMLLAIFNREPSLKEVSPKT